MTVPLLDFGISPFLQDGATDPADPVERLALFRGLVESRPFTTMVPLLPLLLNLKGKPYSLSDHYPFEPFFRTRMPKNIVLKCGRQLGKSQSLAAQGIVITAAIPYFSTLYVTPLFEMIRRFSSNYVRPMIEDSPIRSLLVSSKTEKSVLQRSFINQSRMFFSYAFLDCERVRGISADKCAYDECQDLDGSFIPIIRETMSHSSWALSQFTGTPKTLDNFIESCWQRSSQAEWLMRCQSCGHWNVPSLAHDIDKMIGNDTDVSEERPGIVCAKCGRHSIFPRQGRWVHRFPERRWDFAGYHVPQIIMPLHYADPDKWKELLGKRSGVGNTAVNVFYNEVLGESYDIGARLITKTDLERAGILNENEWDAALAVHDQYPVRILAVDWGGGGEDGVSYTTAAVLGFLPNGRIHVIYGERLLTPHDHMAEAERILKIFGSFGCSRLAHDYTGAGSLRETFLVQAGVPLPAIVPVAYLRAAAANIMVHKPPTQIHPRAYYQVDKARSLLLTCACIKLGHVQFFRYDYRSDDERGLLHDFLSLVENKVPTMRAGDIYTVTRDENLSDDFAQAVNIGCCTLWHMHQAWPRVAELAGMQATSQQIQAAQPNTVDYDDVGTGFFGR